MDYNDEAQRLLDLARQSDVLRNFKESEFFAPLEFIFDILDRKAFETFKKIDPTDTTGIIQAQMMSKVIGQIRQEIERMIQQGDLARETLVHMEDDV